MDLGNWKFDISVSNVDESIQAGESPADYVLRLSEDKARAAVSKADSGQFIVAADTTVVDGGSILGKPKDAAEAVQMLRQLRGHKHQVYTGLTLLKTIDPASNGASSAADLNGNHNNQTDMLKDLCVTNVPMRNYTEADMHLYVQTGDPFDKAGAYAIQHPQFQPVSLPQRAGVSVTDGIEGLKGCFASVMGLPLCHLIRLFRMMGIDQEGDLPAKCQTYLNYQCPVSSAILQRRQDG